MHRVTRYSLHRHIACIQTEPRSLVLVLMDAVWSLAHLTAALACWTHSLEHIFLRTSLFWEAPPATDLKLYHYSNPSNIPISSKAKAQIWNLNYKAQVGNNMNSEASMRHRKYLASSWLHQQLSHQHILKSVLWKPYTPKSARHADKRSKS